MELWIPEKFFLMNVAAFIVAAMNIPQIIECFSPESATFDVLFCLFRTHFIHKFSCVAAHDESFGICLFLVIHCLRFPRSIVNRLSVIYGLRISVEKRFFTMRGNFLQCIPRSFLRFPWSIVRRNLTFSLLRRPRTTTIQFWTTWWWRFLRLRQSIVTCNRFPRILISVPCLPQTWWTRHDRRHPRC